VALDGAVFLVLPTLARGGETRPVQRPAVRSQRSPRFADSTPTWPAWSAI